MAPRHVVVMGVAGSGKSALAPLLARALGLAMVEGDEFHPAANVQKMRQGQALDDRDRTEWLQRLAAQLQARPHGVVLTCSALKRTYRDLLRAAAPGLRFVHLAVTPEVAARRVTTRSGHFYPPVLVASQFEALEDPGQEEDVLVLDASAPLQELAAQTLRRLGAMP
jgi:gluconokinase